VNLRRVARAALVGPIMVAGGMLVLTLGSANVFAASSSGTSANTASHARATASVPISSSKPHEHENVACTPGKVAEKNGQCQVVFTEVKTKDEPNPGGQKVCFSVSPMNAGNVQTGAGKCAVTSSAGKAFGTFMTSGTYCGKAVITATETAENEQAHHTTVTITCKKATTTAFVIAGVPLGGSPVGGLMLGLLGGGAAIATAVALRLRFAPRRLAARQSA
jgi:hypothetical protein